MTTTLAYTTQLTTLSCGVCSIPFAMPSNLYKKVTNDGSNFWCPNGHKIHYFESENARLEKELAQQKKWRGWAESRARAAEDQAAAADRSRRALRGHLTRARKKIANGVCPVGNCRRHFDNVQAHIASEHPQWHVTDPETGKAAVL